MDQGGAGSCMGWLPGSMRGCRGALAAWQGAGCMQAGAFWQAALSCSNACCWGALLRVCPPLTIVSTVLMRGFSANLAGKPVRHVGHVFLPCAYQRLKQPRQKLCWQGPCGGEEGVAAAAGVSEPPDVPASRKLRWQLGGRPLHSAGACGSVMATPLRWRGRCRWPLALYDAGSGADCTGSASSAQPA